MPILTHKKTGQSWDVNPQTIAKLKEQGKLDAYKVEQNTPPKVPKEVKNVGKQKPESDNNGTIPAIDAPIPDGDARQEQ